MNVMIRTHNVELSSDLRALVDQRVRVALDRLTTAVTDVEVLISDLNGPRGGLDKRCRLLVRGRTAQRIVVEQTGAEIAPTISALARKVERAVIKSLARRREFARVVPQAA
jgi:putative sigma-54 modulation protein